LRKNSPVLKITFLGTGTSQGVPVIACNCKVCKSSDPKDKRLRTSIMIEDGDNTFIVDAGPDFRQQMLRENVQDINGILITHEHKDHIGGIDDVRAFNFKNKRAIDIYCDIRVESAIKRELPYSFDNKGYPGAPQMNIHIIDDNSFNLKGKEVKPIKAFHKDLPVYGFRFGNMTYLTDVNAIPDSSLKLMKGSSRLVINALRKEKHLSHFNLKEALDLIEFIKPEKAYLTHVGHSMGLHQEVSKELPDNVEIAYDGMSFKSE
jgi:phosphoribosyl 1,2-cyclic phosphate phosphodiesterase